MTSVVKKLGWALILLLLAGGKVFAAGMAGHVLMSGLALGEVKAPELKGFLAEHREALISGTVYPDSGFTLRYVWPYSERYNWGEDTHRPEFGEADLAYLRSHCPPSLAAGLQPLAGPALPENVSWTFTAGRPPK